MANRDPAGGNDVANHRTPTSEERTLTPLFQRLRAGLRLQRLLAEVERAAAGDGRSGTDLQEPHSPSDQLVDLAIALVHSGVGDMEAIDRLRASAGVRPSDLDRAAHALWRSGLVYEFERAHHVWYLLLTARGASVPPLTQEERDHMTVITRLGALDLYDGFQRLAQLEPRLADIEAAFTRRAGPTPGGPGFRYAALHQRLSRLVGPGSRQTDPELASEAALVIARGHIATRAGILDDKR